MNATATLPNRHCWGQTSRPVPTDAPVLAQFEHAKGYGQVQLHQDGKAYWVSGPRIPYHPTNESPEMVREWCPLFSKPAHFGTSSATCGCRDKSHTCGLCGHPNFIEMHGCADGYCDRCGYHG